MKDLSFEEAKAKIEQIINNMEMGNLPLEESVSQFEEAAKLVKYCQEKLDEFESSVWSMKKAGNVVYATASNATFQGSYNTLRLSGNSPLLRPIFDRQYETVLAAVRVGKTAKEIFEKTKLDATDWSEYYKG